MTLPRKSQRISSSLVALISAITFVAVGCSDSPKKTTPKKAAGGSSGQTSTSTTSSSSNKGGTSAANSSEASSGGNTDDGGSSSKENGGATSNSSDNKGGETAAKTDVSGGGAAAGSSSKTLPDVSCESDLTCKSLGLLCDLKAKKCVECRDAGDCKEGVACVVGICGGSLPSGCKANADCASSTEGKVCDVTRGRCVGCMAAADCPEPTKSECVEHACVTIETCEKTTDCSGSLVCKDTVTPGRCVECTRNEDCTVASKGDVCTNDKCYKKCATAADCTNGLKCNTSLTPNTCVECATHSDCPAEKFCNKGSCIADICVAGSEQACISNGVATCNADGDAFGKSTACGKGQTCTVGSGKAMCAGGSGGSGGGGAGGSSGSSGTGTNSPAPTVPASPPACSTDPGTVNPCEKIPAYSGTQTVDGKGDDFCGVPAFKFTFKNAKTFYVENDNKSKSVDAYTKGALAQVAWTADAFHAYVEVFGTPVKSNTTVDKPWDGDGVELMITTNNTVTGLTKNDANALHLILNKGVGVTVKSDGTNGAHTELPKGQFVGKETSQGYAVEVMIPWPGGASLAAGAELRFDMALNVDMANVDSYDGRDAQAVLAVANLPGDQKTSCGGDPKPYCDDRLWCPTKLEQGASTTPPVSSTTPPVSSTTPPASSTTPPASSATPGN